MKKLIFVLVIGVLIGSTTAFADHPDGLALGGVTNFGWGQFIEDYRAGYFNFGINFKAPHVPVYWAGFVNIKNHSTGFGFTGDYYIIDKTTIDEDRTNENGTYRLKMGWYLGAGFFTNMDMWDNYKVFNMGARVPGGVSWYIIEKLELFVGVAPSFGAWMFRGDSGFMWLINEEVGIRYWF